MFFVCRSHTPMSRILRTVVVSLLTTATTSVAQDRAGDLSKVLVEVTRGSIVESRHYGRLVAVAPTGEIRWSVGDPNELVFPRSALKPLQALATVMLAQEQGLELQPEEIAIMCASHEGHDYHVQAVKLVLLRAGATEDDLYCGPVGGERVRNGCSGKHGGMMLQAKLSGQPLEEYWRVDHPVQQRIQEVIREFTDFHGELQWGPDGCGVPNYALPLYNFALGYARLGNPEAAPEKFQSAANAIRGAMQSHPDLLSKRGSFDAKLIQAGAGRLLAKDGAEACYGLGLSDPSIGVAIKIEDGNPRGMPCVVLHALEQLGAGTAEIASAVGDKRTIDQINSVGVTAGEIRAAPTFIYRDGDVAPRRINK